MEFQNNSYNFNSEITTIAKGAGIVFIGTIIGTGIKFLFEIIIARNLGAELFGLFFIGFSIFKILEIIATLGLHNGILRYGALYAGKGDYQRVKGAIISALKIAILAGILLSIILISFSKLISVNIFHKIEMKNVLIFFSLSLPFSVLAMILVFSIQSFKIMKYKIYEREIFEPLSRILFFILFSLLGWKLYGALVAFLVSCITGTFLAFSFLKKVFPQIIDKRFQPLFESKKLLSFSWPLFFTGFLNVVFLWLGILIVGFFLPQRDVGFFSAAQRTSMLGIIALTSFSAIFAPIIADLYNRKELKKLENLYKIVTKWIFSISFPIFLIMIFYSRNILNIFGEDFIKGASCLIILSIGQLINSVSGSYWYMIMMSGRSKINLINAIITSIINIALCWILIPQYGILGAAISFTISITIINIIGLLEVYMIFKIHPYGINFLKPLLSGVVSLIFLNLITKYLFGFSNSLVILIIGSFGFVVIYGFILYLLGIEEEDKVIIQKIKSKLVTFS